MRTQQRPEPERLFGELIAFKADRDDEVRPTSIWGMDIRIETLELAEEDRVEQVCELLVRSFRELSPTWAPTMEAAREIVEESHGLGMLSRVALVDGRVVGWVGARHDYGSVWELHPLVIDEAERGRGYGRALVEDIERLAAGEGALTMLLGTSDEAGLTNLYGRDLFPDPLAALRELKSKESHPLGFWLKLGYAMVGVVPDAEGPGKPSIMLAKRVATLLRRID